MTNAQIIFAESCRLMREGKIGTTGRVFIRDDGKEIQEPEEIHTFQHWKENGYMVKKGEHAVTKITIWKHTVKKAKNEGEEDEQKMYMKTASFFSRSQVESIA